MTLVRGPRRARVTVISVVISALAAVGLPMAASAKPGDSTTPTVTSVTAKLDALAKKTERLAEQYNKARIDVVSAQHAVDTSRRTVAEAATRYGLARAKFLAVITDQYENGSPSAAGSLLVSDSGPNYLDRLDMAALAAKHQSDVVNSVKSAKTAATAARARADSLLRSATAKRRAVSDQRAQTAAQTSKFKSLLATLTAAQQAAYARRDAATAAQQRAVKPAAASTGTSSGTTQQQGSTTSVQAGSAAAQRAVDFALAQVGKPYVFGAAGPGSYDCSGLTMAAWRAGGVSLPHLAADQYNFGTHVSVSSLQPGDLVFMYSPIGHVSMYIGKGMLVSAPQPGENVKIVPLSYFTSDVVGATRLA